MVEIQLSQMLVTKLMAWFRLQAYVGATIIDDGNQALSDPKKSRSKS